jgi:superfamily II DNA or RNA helicase
VGGTLDVRGKVIQISIFDLHDRNYSLMNIGIYEELVTKLIRDKIDQLDPEKFYIKETEIDKEEASEIITNRISQAIKYAMSLIKGEHSIDQQISIANKIIQCLKDEIRTEDFEDDIIDAEGRILKAVFNKVDSHFRDFDLHLKEITPYTRLSHSELFTGGNAGITLESELRKEILSSDQICLLVSFIKWKGVRILEKELKSFTDRGGKLRIITTTYIGATDFKAIEILSHLSNTEIKISYNTGNERLHAKAYLFYRNTGFHTGYIGSSNFSRTALTDGLEWNLKVTTREVSHIIDKFQKTFDTYWLSPEFETFSKERDSERLKEALNKGKSSSEVNNTTAYFDLKPFHFQDEILRKLEAERLIHGRFKNLIVAATGTGKTVISAFDYKAFRSKSPRSRLLFVAHRKEILLQARYTFQGILKDNNFGELWVDGLEPESHEYLFASIATLKNRLPDFRISPDYYDFIIIDEVHHIAASSYRPIVNFFKPKILLGLTATPERTDGEDILEDFGGRIAAEIRLPEALNRKLLCPFQYFGISDSIDLSMAKWERGYVASELTSIYTADDRRVNEVIGALDKYTHDINDVRALGFCASKSHAKYMAEKFLLSGLKADYLTSDNSDVRESIRSKFVNKVINYLFVVDMFNEGVDIEQIDTVLFLRPTQSLTIFLQQLGRGLRLSEGKECLTVLDFVGNCRPEYDFEHKFRGLIGKTATPVLKEIEDNFPHLPLGCSIVLEKKAKEIILENIKKATTITRSQLINKIINFEHQSSLPFNLSNFLDYYNLPIESIYKKACWGKLCFEAGKIKAWDGTNEKQIQSAIQNKWLSTSCFKYFSFILKLANKSFVYVDDELSQDEKLMMTMLHYDFWQKELGFKTMTDSIASIGKNQSLTKEIIEVLEYLLDRIDIIEKDIDLPYAQPLKVYGRYTRDQILSAFQLSSFEKKSSNREGVAENKNLNTELLFVDLIKSEEDFSPSTLYNDYAINEYLFHWQSQNKTKPDSPKGLSYLTHQSMDKIILLFVRESATNEYGNTMGYVFLGKADFKNYYGSKPMSITWELKEPIPSFLWKETAKFSVG